MPFMKGRGALRRTLDYLQRGEILLRENVRILTFAYNPGKRFPHHHGLSNFVFWHLPQLKYKNPETQLVTFRMITPTPWIRAYLDDDTQVLIDCSSRSREEIHNHLKRVVGKTEETLAREEEALAAKVANPANFGVTYNRQCICEVPGQVPCPGWQPLPKELTGKWRRKMKEEGLL